jgi:hypothetical protein
MVAVNDWERCVECGELIRPPRPGDGIDPRDFDWVHGGGNPLCDLDPPTARPTPKDGD